jgi:hypothetical protein
METVTVQASRGFVLSDLELVLLAGALLIVAALPLLAKLRGHRGHGTPQQRV